MTLVRRLVNRGAAHIPTPDMLPPGATAELPYVQPVSIHAALWALRRAHIQNALVPAYPLGSPRGVMTPKLRRRVAIIHPHTHPGWLPMQRALSGPTFTKTQNCEIMHFFVHIINNNARHFWYFFWWNIFWRFKINRYNFYNNTRSALWSSIKSIVRSLGWATAVLISAVRSYYTRYHT